MSTKLCGEHAAFRYTWPGKPEAHACVDHAMALARVANAMSFPLQLIPLTYKVGDAIPEEFPTCTQQVKPETEERKS